MTKLRFPATTTLIAALSCSAASLTFAEDRETADIAFVNANIHTMDTTSPTARAIAIKGDEIVYVGDMAGIKQFTGADTQVTDLKGKMVLPGFVDAHSHAVAGGLIMNGVDLQSDNKEEIFARIRKEVASNNSDIIMGYGVRFTPWAEGNPTAAMLDEIEADRPVYFWTISGHGAWVNSKTLEIAGIDKNSPEPAPGYSFFERDTEGNPTGWIVELPAQMQVLSALVDITPRYLKASIEEWLPRFSAAGITTVQDLGIQGASHAEGFQLFLDLAKAGALPVRMRGVYYWNNSDVDPVAEYQALGKRFNHPLVQLNKIKINIDGGDDSKNALYVDGYADDPTLDPDPIIPAKVITDRLVSADALGIDSVCHCFGDGAVRIMLDAVETAIARNSKRDRRFVVTHGASVHEEDIPRFAELDVGYDSTGAWMSYDPNLQSISNVRLGEKRVQAMFPAQKIVAAGGRFSLGSDWPVSGYISEYRPLVAIETAVTRTLDGRKDTPPLGGAEAGVSVDTAIRAATINAAYNMGIDDEVGSLTVGKKADLVVLDKNLFDLDSNDISEVEVLQTVMGGETVFKAD